MKQEITVLSHSASGYQSPDIQICQYVCKETILQTSGLYEYEESPWDE